MRSRSLKVLLLAGLVTGAPLPARAESLSFDNYCVIGALQVCASVRVTTAGNSLTMQVWNLNGTEGTSHTITAIGLYHYGSRWTGTVTGFNATYVNGAQSTDVTRFWQTPRESIRDLGQVRLELGQYTALDGKMGIVGCTDPRGTRHLSTCNSFPGSPYVQFTFTLSQPFTLANVFLRWHSQQVPGLSSNGLKCDTRDIQSLPACDGPSPSVAPEPMTMALVGTGLFGIGGAGWVRRRRGRAGPRS